MKIFTDIIHFRTLSSTDTVFNAFKLLKGDFGMIINVLDGDNFLGIVTAGDLRKVC